MKKAFLILLAVGAFASCTQTTTEGGETTSTTETDTTKTVTGTEGDQTSTTTDDSITVETATGMDTTSAGGRAAHGAAADQTQGSQAR